MTNQAKRLQYKRFIVSRGSDENDNLLTAQQSAQCLMSTIRSTTYAQRKHLTEKL